MRPSLDIGPEHRPSHAAQAAAELAWSALAEARPGRVLLVLAGSLTGPPAGAAPQEVDLVALDHICDELGGAPVDLVLQSAGASFEVAEEVLTRLHRWASHLAVLVPRRVRGGLSLLACLADELVLGPRGAIHPPLPSLPVAGRVHPADLALLETARDPSGAARARAALDHVRGQLVAGLVARRGLAASDAEQVALKLTSTPVLGLPGRALHGRDLGTLGVELLAPPPALDHALRLVDTALYRCLPPGGHWTLGPAGGFLRPAPGTRPAPHPVPEKPEQAAPGAGVPELPEVASVAVFEVRCECGTVSKIQANLETSSPLQDGHWAFPPDGVFLCPECMDRKDLRPLRRQLEEKTHRKVVT